MSHDKRVTLEDVILASGIGIAGICAIRWILQHPDDAIQIRMRILLATQKTFLAISDRCRYIADRAGTEYNKVRV
jgi:hypothetical protein